MERSFVVFGQCELVPMRENYVITASGIRSHIPTMSNISTSGFDGSVGFVVPLLDFVLAQL